ncbi:MAG: acyltransferase family protein [Candidatus Helarchaeota archaeon]
MEPKNSEIKKPKIFSRDWRIEAARIPSTITIIFGHMFLYTSYIPQGSPLGWPIPVAIGVFIYCAGYVNGLKDDFNKPGTLTLSNYAKYVKKRFLRLFSGYYLAFLAVFIARILSGTLPPIDPFNIFLDFTSLWSIFKPGGSGSIWNEGWFVGAIFIISLVYPFIKRLKSINKYYILLVIAITSIIRIFLLIFISPIYAYFTPYAWFAEYSVGMIIGEYNSKYKLIPIVKRKFQRLIIKGGDRTWPMYLVHVIPILFMSYLAPVWQFVIAFLVILLLTEVFYWILKYINRVLKRIM